VVIDIRLQICKVILMILTLYISLIFALSVEKNIHTRFRILTYLVISMEIRDAIKMLKDNFKRADKNVYIQKPISYALYKTWRYFNEIEEPRKAKIDD